MILDLERLHDVLEGKYNGVRRQGHSTALLVQLIQSAILSPESTTPFVVIVLNRTVANYLVDLMIEVYEALGYMDCIITRRPGYVQFGNTKVEFISHTNIRRGLRNIPRIQNFYVDKPVVLSSADYIELQNRLTK